MNMRRTYSAVGAMTDNLDELLTVFSTLSKTEAYLLLWFLVNLDRDSAAQTGSFDSHDCVLLKMINA